MVNNLNLKKKYLKLKKKHLSKCNDSDFKINLDAKIETSSTYLKLQRGKMINELTRGHKIPQSLRNLFSFGLRL